MTFASQVLALLLLLPWLFAGPAQSPEERRLAADRMQQKLDHIQQNGLRETPDPKPTELTKEEIDAYLADGRVKLPVGVQQVTFESNSGVVTARSRVDFDEITAGRRSVNPLLVIFTGVHDVDIVARAQASSGVARVEIESVAMDGVNIPRRALEFYIERFVRQKYPQVGLDTSFNLPARIDTAVLGENKIIIVQR